MFNNEWPYRTFRYIGNLTPTSLTLEITPYRKQVYFLLINVVTTYECMSLILPKTQSTYNEAQVYEPYSKSFIYVGFTAHNAIRAVNIPTGTRLMIYGFDQ